MTVSIVIPARLRSSRLPHKVLNKLQGLEMIEHVRRRASLCTEIDSVYVATCDQEIANLVHSYGGEVIITSNLHTSGTSRVGQAIGSIDSDHVIVLQADEPLVLPEYLDVLATSMKSECETYAWNLVAPLEPDDLNDPSVVKCSISENQQILYCFRKNPSIVEPSSYVRTLLGIHGYTKEFLSDLCSLDPTPIESFESIEQMRILESGKALKAVEVSHFLPSVNTPHDLQKVISLLQLSSRQNQLYRQIMVA